MATEAQRTRMTDALTLCAHYFGEVSELPGCSYLPLDKIAFLRLAPFNDRVAYYESACNGFASEAVELACCNDFANDFAELTCNEFFHSSVTDSLRTSASTLSFLAMKKTASGTSTCSPVPSVQELSTSLQRNVLPRGPDDTLAPTIY